jgi:hypothetical protein
MNFTPMNTRRRPARIALLLSLTLFGALIYWGSLDRPVFHDEHDTALRFGLDLDLQWIADADQADFAVVQDTLHHYAGQLGMFSGALSARFELDHLDLQAVSDQQLYKLQLSMDFDAPDAGHALLTQWVTQGYLSPYAGSYRHGFADGATHVHLPIPGSDAATLHIDGAAYHLRLVPRMTDLTLPNPGA